MYVPNIDDPFFFENVLKHFLTFKCEEIILGGDFNLVLDVQKDKKGGSPVTHKKSLQKVKYIVDSLDLTDIWRFLNADTKRFRDGPLEKLWGGRGIFQPQEFFFVIKFLVWIFLGHSMNVF